MQEVRTALESKPEFQLADDREIAPGEQPVAGYVWLRKGESKRIEKALPLTEPIGHRALIYIEQHALSSGLRAGDAIVAATAVENRLALASTNRKHFSKIEALDLVVFRP
jgi:predicted nucleic acid-binding protein